MWWEYTATGNIAPVKSNGGFCHSMGQNSQIARGHFAIDGRVFGTTAIFHLCDPMTTRCLLRPTQTRRSHSDKRQREDKNVDKMSQSESPILWGYISLSSGHLIFLFCN